MSHKLQVQGACLSITTVLLNDILEQSISAGVVHTEGLGGVREFAFLTSSWEMQLLVWGLPRAPSGSTPGPPGGSETLEA